MPAVKRVRITLLGVLAALALLSAVVSAVLVGCILARSTNALFSTRADVVVPDLTGLPAEQAAQEAWQAGLAVVWKQAYSAAHEAGTVCDQQPRAGRTVKQGQQLTLTASEGVRRLTVPDLRQLPQKEASQQLRDAGFGVTVEFITDGTLEAYTVLRTEPEAGSQCEVGTLIKLVVVRPMPDPYRAVPKLTGLTVQAARSHLQGIGLGAIVVGDQQGIVASQEPGVGNILRVGSGVTLYAR